MMRVRETTIYVALLDEGTACWRPVQAEVLENGSYRIVSDNADPEDEHWEFPPGSVVRCTERRLSGGLCLVATSRLDGVN